MSFLSIPTAVETAPKLSVYPNVWNKGCYGKISNPSDDRDTHEFCKNVQLQLEGVAVKSFNPVKDDGLGIATQGQGSNTR
jgi:hypothetical protein